MRHIARSWLRLLGAVLIAPGCDGAIGTEGAPGEEAAEGRETMAYVTSWDKVPTFVPTTANLSLLFQKTIYTGTLAPADINFWYSRKGFARTYPNASRVKLPGLVRNYIGVPWQPHPFIDWVTKEDYLIEMEAKDSTGAVAPFGVLDVYGNVGNTFGLYSTGAMKNPTNVLAPATGATSATWGGPLWPETSKFPGLLPLLPTQILIPNTLGTRVTFAVPPPGRATDNWAAFIGMSNAVSRGAAPSPCVFRSEQQIGIPIPSSASNTIHALRKIDLGGDMGTRWVLIYSNYDDIYKKREGYVEYFGIDLAPGNVWPGSGPPTYGRVLYGQQAMDANGTVLNWSMALWNRVVPRTGKGRIFSCSNTTPVVDVTLP